VGFFPGFVLLFVGFDVVREDSQFDGLRWSERTRVTSPRRPRFAVGGLGTPVRSEIGCYRALAERATILNHPGNLGCGYAGLGAMRVRVRGSSVFCLLSSCGTGLVLQPARCSFISLR